MSWNYQRSLDRIQDHLDGMGTIEIKKLVRETDLQLLLSEICCRRIYGAHVYAEVSNFARLASNSIYIENDYKRLTQAVHIYQREMSRIVENSDIFNGLRVHFQGVKLHALFYRPIDDAEGIATRAVLLQLVLKDFVDSVFNPAFPNYENFTVASGADIGDAIGTRNGMRGDRELLFLGAPANHAAKIINTGGQICLTENIYDALPVDLQELCIEVETDLYKVISVNSTDLDKLLDIYQVGWDREASANRVKADKQAFPLKDISYSSADVLIDLDSLSINNNKRVLGATIFADVSGFTKYIDSAETEEDQRAALRVFHAIRKEMAQVIRRDFGGLRIQFQGDRIQGLFHLPKDDEESITLKVVEAAVGVQSSMEKTIKKLLPETADLQLAVGIDLGTTLVSKLGTRAHRDRICLGQPVEQAAKREEGCEGGQIGIPTSVYNKLPESLSQHFAYSRTAQCYIATSLTADKVEQAAKAHIYQGNGPVFVHSATSGVTVAGQESRDARPIIPSRPYSIED